MRTGKRDAAGVFVNCPFDGEYRSLFQSIIFTLIDCGYHPRCALERQDSGQTRIERIYAMIGECPFGIHDISRTELDEVHGLPRFNMPLELGLFLGAHQYGGAWQRQKKCLILDIERYRYQKFCSDIAGQDIVAHQGDPRLAVAAVRNWLRSINPESKLPSGAHVWNRYSAFREKLPGMGDLYSRDTDPLIYADFVGGVQEWELLSRDDVSS